MRFLLDGLDIRLPVIELNGAAITDLRSGRRSDTQTLSPDAARTAISVLEAAGGGTPIVTGWDHETDLVHYGAPLNRAASWYVAEKREYGDPRLRACSDLSAVPGRSQVATVVGFVSDDRSADVASALTTGLGPGASVSCASNFYVPGWSEVAVAHPCAEKGLAVRRLRELAGLSDARITVYGDHLNDLTMFAVADRSVAPSNAHPDVLRRADLVIGHNDDDSVAGHLALQERGFSKGVSCLS